MIFHQMLHYSKTLTDDTLNDEERNLIPKLLGQTTDDIMSQPDRYLNMFITILLI